MTDRLERPNPPYPGKVTHHSAELFWKIPRKGPRISVILQQSLENENEFETIYTGFGKRTEARELTHESAYKFRLRYEQESNISEWSPVTEVNTKKKPMNGDDLHRMVQNRNLTGLKNLLKDKEIAINAPDKMGNSPLMAACIKGYDDISEILLAHDAEVNYSNSAGKSSLMLACYHGNVNCIEVLLSYGGDWVKRDKSGSSAFHWAIDGGHVHVVERILNQTDNVDEEDLRSGWSPLMRLVTVNGSVTIAKMLIDRGADVNFKDKTGKLVLMGACLNGNKAMVQLLVDNGADLWCENEFGKTAYDMAKAFERRAVMKYIEEMEEFYPRPPSMRVKALLQEKEEALSSTSTLFPENLSVKFNLAQGISNTNQM